MYTISITLVISYLIILSLFGMCIYWLGMIEPVRDDIKYNIKYVTHILKNPLDKQNMKKIFIFISLSFLCIYILYKENIINKFVLRERRGTLFSEECDFCRFKDSIAPRTCLINTFEDSVVIINCNECHDFPAEIVSSIISFSTQFLNGTRLENISIDINNLSVNIVVFLSRIIKRPLWFLFGLIDGLINPGTCLSFEDIVPQLILWGQDMLDCYNFCIDIIAFNLIPDLFEFTVGVFLFIGVIIIRIIIIICDLKHIITQNILVLFY